MSELGEFRKDSTCQQDPVKDKQNRGASRRTRTDSLHVLSFQERGASPIQWDLGKEG